VIVKRPRLAVYLANQEPNHQWQGDACRFDAYFQSHLIE
jgi:16S rRNA (guanine1516-N2)-methyltransferase